MFRHSDSFHEEDMNIDDKEINPGAAGHFPAHAANAMQYEFDFDYWAALARTSPQRFAQERERLIRQLLDQAPERNKSIEMQMAIDADRYACGLGLRASCQALKMSLASAEQLSTAVQELSKLIAASSLANWPAERKMDATNSD